MRKGLVLGKFMPLHKGHIKLIEFAKKNCEQLIILICSTCREPINGGIRCNWLKKYFKQDQEIDIFHFYYDDKQLPGTLESPEKVSRIWATVLKEQFPNVDCFISSKPYGKHIARFMGVKSLFFDVKISEVPFSTAMIRSNPYKYWNFLPEIVKKHYYRKVCIIGTESTGKSTLVKKLAAHYNSDYVLDVGWKLVDVTDKCTFTNLATIAETHAKKIIEKDKQLNKILFVDTDVYITKSYANFLFSRDLVADEWILNANRFDLYIYLENDALFIQDSTRLSFEERNKLDKFHKEEFDFQNLHYWEIKGSWEERFLKALEIINCEFRIS